MNLRAPSAELAPGQGQRGVERLSAASGVTKYYYFGSQRVALQTASGITYLHADHLGSTSVTSGAVSSTQVYYPYGSVRAMTGSAPTDYGFTGQRLDSFSVLMYYGARYYDPAMGRFTQPDGDVPNPADPQGLNRYAYSKNNPLRYKDPSGHDWSDVVNVAGEFFTGAADEAWYNVAWFVPMREGLKVQQGESQAQTAGRVLGDTIALGIAAGQIVAGDTLIGGGAVGGAVTCVETLGGGCVAGGAAIAGGAALEGLALLRVGAPC